MTGGTASPSHRTGEARRRGTSVKPALVVVGAAAVILVVFGVGAAITGSHAPAPVRAPHVDTSLAAAPATKALRPIEDPAAPPPDVLGALVVPAKAAPVSKKPWDRQTQYNASMDFTLPASQGAVVHFYRAELRARGWSITSVGAARANPRATEVLAQRASSDGWYWDIGVVVSPTTFSSRSGPESTRFLLDLYEVPDPQ